MSLCSERRVIDVETCIVNVEVDYCTPNTHYLGVVQLVACVIWDHVVVGSSPATQTKKFFIKIFIYELIFGVCCAILCSDEIAGVAQWQSS